MASNLPPGVSDNMIPGNRPDDVWMEKFTDELIFPEWVFELPPSEVAGFVNTFFEEMGRKIFDQAFQIGRQEAQIDQASEVSWDPKPAQPEGILYPPPPKIIRCPLCGRHEPTKHHLEQHTQKWHPADYDPAEFDLGEDA